MSKWIKYGLCIIVMLISLYLIYNHYEYQVVSDNNNQKLKDNIDFMQTIKNEYNNNEIVLYIEIPKVLSLPVVQTEDNTYYFSHNLNREEDAMGTPFLDYRNSSVKDKKLIIYGHNIKSKELDFSNIVNYNDKNFFLNNPVISIQTDEGKKSYKVFSSFSDDFKEEYFTLNDYNGISFYEHINSLKEKSIYDTKVEVDKESKILLLTTCAYNECSKGHSKYQYVVAVEDIE